MQNKIKIEKPILLDTQKRTVHVIFQFLTILIISIPNAYAQDKENHNGVIKVASCQFPISDNIIRNLEWITNQTMEAKLKKADIVHFPECALSGYPGTDFEGMDGFNWEMLYAATDSVIQLARELEIWIILGSMHKLTGSSKPHNSLYIINPEGKIVDRYDKRFCTSGDLEYFTPGDHFVTFPVNGVVCGLLICYDIRFPELYREYRKLEADLIFQSFHNARQKKGSIHPIIMPTTAQARAATNYFFMSLTNSSARESWPCHFITPDGLVQNKLSLNEPGILISEVDINARYYDASGPYRNNAMHGILNSGEIIEDDRSINRKNH